VISLLPQALSAFFASLVEFVEALTVVLAVASVRGWRPALQGAALGLLILLIALAALGPALALLPLRLLQGAVGLLLLLFGLRWLRKAILRSAGRLPLHDEAATFVKESSRMAEVTDWVAIGTACKIVLLEGAEVVFIVIALGSAGGQWLAAELGAGAALLLVIALGALLHKPLTKVPENALKFTVGLLLSAFGLFWTAEGLGFAWPGDDWALLGLFALFAAGSWILVTSLRPRPGMR